jgi:hypothetical protein
MIHGTIQIPDTLRALDTANGTVAQFGIDKAYELIQKDADVHNALVNDELIPDLCETTEDREITYGAADDMTVEEIDEYGRPDTQKVGFAETLGLPLSSYGRSIGWTWDVMQVITPRELLMQYLAAQTADLKGIKVNILRRVFNPFDTLEYVDAKIDKRKLKLYAFYNADGMQVWPGPDGQDFDPDTHTHYTASTTLSASVIDALIGNVLEHGRAGKLELRIARVNESQIRALNGAGQFLPYDYSYVIPPTNEARARGELDPDNIEDRAIGMWGPAEVWVKPYQPSNYLWVLDKGVATQKPLKRRTRKGGAFANWGLRGKHRNEDFPLFADTLARDYGVGVGNRHMSAAHFVDGGGVYAQPTITG